MRDSVSIRAAAAAAILCVTMAGCGDDDNSTTTPSSTAFSLACTVTPTAGQAPLVVSLSTRLSPVVPVSLIINYGDGTAGNNPNAAHVYRAPGNYSLAVTATSGSQTASCPTTTVTVSAPPPVPANREPVASFHTSPNPPVGPAPLTVALNLCQSADPDGDRMLYHFNFGDGTRATPGCRVDHVYARGTYVAEGCVTDGVQGHNSCRTITVVAQ